MARQITLPVKFRQQFMINDINQIQGVRRLPLWKSCVEEMRVQGVDYGKVYTAEYFEQRLKCKRDEMEFGLAISEIRRDLETSGFYLSGRGQSGNQYVILPPENNRGVMSGYQRAALDALKRGIILGTTTRLDTLSAEDRRRHESVLEKMAMRHALVRNTTQIVRVLKKHAPKILNRRTSDEGDDNAAMAVTKLT